MKKSAIILMDLIRQYKVVVAVLLPVLILVLCRSVGPYHFKTDAGKYAEPSFLKSNIIAIGQAAYMPGDKLIINLDKENGSLDGTNNAVIGISADSVLNRRNLKTIRSHEGPVLLFSSEPAIAARIWMVLSQMGCENLFILTNDPENEKPDY